MLRTPDGRSRIELAKYRSPEAITPGVRNQPHNVLGTHRVMFAVDDIKDTVARLRSHGAELLGEFAEFEKNVLCYLRGPEGIVVGLIEPPTALLGGASAAGVLTDDTEVERTDTSLHLPRS